MGDLINPYIAGAPVTEARMFFGREDVFQWIENSIAGQYADHILVIHGQRRVGKTSVLKQLGNRLPKRYIPVFFDLQGRTHTTLDRFLWWLAREIVRVLKQDRGIEVPLLPGVRTTDGHIVQWNRNRIVRQIVEETKLVETFYGYKGATEDVAQEIARDVENRIKSMQLKSLSGPLIREIVNMMLLEKGMIQYRNVCSRVGTPVYDAHQIDVGRGFEAHDNANLQENAETSHKKKADKISKEQYLLQLPPELADHHLSGEMHIHDLEYFGTRPFCQDWDLRYFFYYGLMPDGNGTKASVAGPAKRAEVAILHAVKALGSAQTNFAGGQGAGAGSEISLMYNFAVANDLETFQNPLEYRFNFTWNF